MKEYIDRCCSVLLPSVAHTTGRILYPLINDWQTAHAEPHRRRKRRRSGRVRWLGSGLFRFVKYGLAMGLIASTVFVLLRASFDFAVDASSGGAGSVPNAVTTSAPSMAKALPDSRQPAAERQPPTLDKLQSIDKAIPYEVTAYAAKLWQAIDSASDKDLRLQRGSRVEVLDIQGEWLHVKTESGLTGFVHQSLVLELPR